FIILFFSNDTTTPEIYTLSYTTLFRSVVNEVRHALGRGADATQVAPTFLVEPGGVVFLERLAEAVDAAERGPQVVRHRIGEGLELLVGRLELGGARLDLGFGAPPLAQVPRHLREPQQRPALVTHGGHHDVGPKAGAVLADAPVLLLVAARRGGGLEGCRWLAGGGVFRGVEPRKVLADDLLRGVALDLLRPAVPAHHVAGGIEHVDGVVAHVPHEQAEALLTDP